MVQWFIISMKASDVFIKALENEGVHYIFGIPGEETLDLLESIRKSKKIKFVLTRHEQAAGFMAATVGRLTGNPGVCLSTLGPGATNLVTAVAYSQLGAMPAIFITGQKGIKQNKQGNFQKIDVTNMMRPITKHAKTIVHSSSIAADVHNAFNLAKEERPGAVHLELPEDIAKEEVINPTFFETSNIRRPVAEEKAINQAVILINASKSPIILIGAGANRKRVSKTLTEFIEKTKIPFITTQMGKGVVDERHNQYLGTTSLSENDSVHKIIEKSDLIINIGHDIIEKPPFIIKPNDPKKIIHINFFSSLVNETYHPTLEVIGDIANAIWQINSKITNFKNKKIITTKIKETNTALSWVIKKIRNSLTDDSILVLDNGLYKLWVSRDYKCYSPNTLLLDNALATMGAGLPSAMAAKLLYPKKEVVVLTGDGGFMMNSQELETIKRLSIKLTIIIINNGSYHMIKWKQKLNKLNDFGLNFGNPDFTKYSNSYGFQGHKVDNKESFEKAFDNALNDKATNIIDLNIDY